MHVNSLTLGAIPQSGGSCHFRVWAPRNKWVQIHLLEANRFLDLTPAQMGYHDALATDVPVGTLYRICLDGQLERPDPASRHQPQGVHGPSQVMATEFPWTDHNWQGRPLSELVIYELHVGTFTSDGTFDAAIARLDDLVSLGITAIELMPLAQFPGGRNWGYDGVYPFAVQTTYGGPDGLKRFVDACHSKGLAVLHDVVYNHLGPEGNYLGDFGPFFSSRYNTEWGPSPNFDGPGSHAVRRYFLENALYWKRELHLDGLRLDAVNWIFDTGAQHFLEELSAAAHSWGGPPFLLIGESLQNDPRLIRSREAFGYGLDGQWCDDFHHALHVLLTGETTGYYQDFGSVHALAQALRQGYFFTGQYCEFRQRHHGRAPAGALGHQFVIYAQNHDQVGNRARGERLSALAPFEAQKLAAAATLLSANVPLLFMGEEYGETAPFPFFISHGDPYLVDAVRKGRSHEFAMFGWKESDLLDPQAESTYAMAKLNWAARNQGRGREMLDWYAALLRLRRETPALANLDHGSLSAIESESPRYLIVTRTHGASKIFFVLYLQSETGVVELPIPSGEWMKRLDSGSTWPDRLCGGVQRVNVPPWSVVLYADLASGEASAP